MLYKLKQKKINLPFVEALVEPTVDYSQTRTIECVKGSDGGGYWDYKYKLPSACISKFSWNVKNKSVVLNFEGKPCGNASIPDISQRLDIKHDWDNVTSEFEHVIR